MLLPTEEVQFKTVTKRRNIRVKLVENSVDNSRCQVETGNIDDVGSNTGGLEDLVRSRESPNYTVTTPNVSTKRKIEEEIVRTKRQKVCICLDVYDVYIFV